MMFREETPEKNQMLKFHGCVSAYVEARSQYLRQNLVKQQAREDDLFIRKLYQFLYTSLTPTRASKCI